MLLLDKLFKRLKYTNAVEKTKTVHSIKQCNSINCDLLEELREHQNELKNIKSDKDLENDINIIRNKLINYFIDSRYEAYNSCVKISSGISDTMSSFLYGRTLLHPEKCNEISVLFYQLSQLILLNQDKKKKEEKLKQRIKEIKDELKIE